MAIIVTKPVEAPTNLSAVVSLGGSLEANTTYYYILIAYDVVYTTCSSYSRTPFFSDISEEGTFNTTSDNRTVTIYWDNSAGATRYNIILTTTSGVYNTIGCGGYGGVVNENIGTISDGTIGFEITARSTSIALFHSCQLVNPMSPHISDNTGLIWVNFTGSSYTLDSVYTAIIAAGYSDYVYYDGYNFVMKGWIYADSSAGVGEFIVENKRMTMLKGGIKNRSAEYVFRFGRYGSDYYGGNPSYGCNIDLQGARYTFMGQYSKSILLYDSYVSFGKSRTTRLGAEWGYNYFNSGNGSFFYLAVDGFSSNVLNGTGRGTNTDILDSKWGAGNNWSDNNFIRLDIWNSPNMPYNAGLGSFYDCNWNTFGGSFNIHIFDATKLTYVDMYDCKFNGYPNGMIENPYVRFRTTYSLITESYIRNNYSVSLQVLDKDGNALEGVQVRAIDGNGNAAEWIEQDGSKDKLVTGNKFTSDRTTDAEGKIFYYLKAYKNYLNPENTTENYSYDTIKENYYPYTIVISKDGYDPVYINVLTLSEPVVSIVTLNESAEDPAADGLTNAYETEAMRHLFLNEPIPKIGDAGGLLPSVVAGNLFVALFTQSPGEPGSIAYEATFSGYARIPIPRGSTGWNEYIGKVKNINPVSFPENAGGEETIRYYAIMKELTGPEMIASGKLKAPETIIPGFRFQFGPYALEFNID